MTPTDQVTRDRVLEQGDLQTRQIVIIKQMGCAPDKDRQLDENHSQLYARSGLSIESLEVNQRWGKHTMKLGSNRLTQAPRGWVMKQERRTPPYTTQWEEIPWVRA
jgi:DNA polymerase V